MRAQCDVRPNGELCPNRNWQARHSRGFLLLFTLDLSPNVLVVVLGAAAGLHGYSRLGGCISVFEGSVSYLKDDLSPSFLINGFL